MTKKLNKEILTVTIFNGKKYPAKHLREEAFARGRKDFREGKRIPMTFSKVQEIDVEKLRNALNQNKATLAEKLADKLLDQHIILMYHFNLDGTPMIHEITGFYKTVADNPYPEGSFAYKEWQRGFNQAYARNLKKDHNERFSSSRTPRHHRNRPKYGSPTTVNA